MLVLFPDSSHETQQLIPIIFDFPDDGGVQSSTYRPILRSTTISNEIQTRDVCVQFAGQLCAHNCVTEGSSYRCTCREGFRLLPDAKSCQRDPYGSSPSFISSTSPSQSRPPPPTPYETQTHLINSISKLQTFYVEL